MKKLKSTTLLIAALMLTGGFIFSSCEEPKDTLAKIIIRDADETIVPGASVIIYGEPTDEGQTQSNVGDTTKSNGAGEAIFNLNDLYKPGQAGVAVLNISATKTDADGVVLTGTGIIKIEAETTNTETVFIQ